ncbi:helix-turn-helix domain-containing protein [Roseovarius nanhaiticus]|uniref:Helix-turn-helix n=1 Tax=Roseovarius nanhaiticus TaxID=573024 RepID=A0A1N7FMK8_9RHOB|nr:helix-turn-helix transcriptional regulator [Roseovarius nanhaiticus]SEK50889.1 Helix-turn-helix [Roseovarius nanhaiticus]SIS01505.1 Helix-turn-helix [Roseovarius nanhaiticus]
MNDDSAEKWFDPDATTFGDRLAGAREMAGMTQAQLAKRLGVKKKTLEEWENDVRGPRAMRLSMLAGLLNVSLLWLLTGEGDGPGEPGEATSYVRGGEQLLDEIRAISAQMTLNAERLVRVEGELKALLKASDA